MRRRDDDPHVPLSKDPFNLVLAGQDVSWSNRCAPHEMMRNARHPGVK